MKSGGILQNNGRQMYYCLLIFFIGSLQTGYAFRLYRTYGTNNDDDNRSSVNSGYEQVTSLLEDCVRATCGESDTYRNLCTIHCLLRMAKATDPENEFASEHHHNVQHKSRLLGSLPSPNSSPGQGNKLFSRQVNSLNACIEARCAGMAPLDRYNRCVADNCLNRFHLGLRDAETDEQPDGWQQQQQGPEKSHVSKRVTEPCNCHPGVNDFPACIRACK